MRRLALAALLLSPALAHAEGPLRVAAPFEIVSPDPAISGSIFTRMGIAETLVEVDADGRLTPGLASASQADPDGLTWRFDLREGGVLP